MIIAAISIQHLTLSLAKQFEVVLKFLKTLPLETGYATAFVQSGPSANGSIHFQKSKRFQRQLRYLRERTQISAVVITMKTLISGFAVECGKVRLHDV